MENSITKVLKGSLIVLLVFQLTGCGTLFYPERRGQRGGHLDAGVVILDGIGLLFFLIPGIIAFAVDFSNGTIYLPGGRYGHLREVKFDPKRTSLAQVERIIQDETGRSVKLTQSNMQVSRLKSQGELAEHFSSVDQEGNRLALNR
ncbi:MAG: hypothetical protein HQL15_02850 [Candidatus Omnitrophica bacterium]|nr:hypothetical protein [Candidatus Omnitrophota bacterium]